MIVFKAQFGLFAVITCDFIWKTRHAIMFEGLKVRKLFSEIFPEEHL
jgi:hypothetical protein